MFRLTLIALALAQGLLPAQSLGKITDKITDVVTRQPIAKAHVGCNVGQDFIGVLSGLDGAYTLENVPAGEVRMTINLDGYKLINDNQDADAGFTIAAGDTVTRNFAMHPLGRIYGRLTDRDSGKPIEGSSVSAGRREYVPGHVYYMGGPGSPGPSHGNYDLANLEAGDYRISIESPDEPVVAFTADAAAAKPGGDKFTAIGGIRMWRGRRWRRWSTWTRANPGGSIFRSRATRRTRSREGWWRRVDSSMNRLRFFGRRSGAAGSEEYALAGAVPH